MGLAQSYIKEWNNQTLVILSVLFSSNTAAACQIFLNSSSKLSDLPLFLSDLPLFNHSHSHSHSSSSFTSSSFFSFSSSNLTQKNKKICKHDPDQGRSTFGRGRHVRSCDPTCWDSILTTLVPLHHSFTNLIDLVGVPITSPPKSIST